MEKVKYSPMLNIQGSLELSSRGKEIRNWPEQLLISSRRGQGSNRIAGTSSHMTTCKIVKSNQDEDTKTKIMRQTVSIEDKNLMQ